MPWTSGRVIRFGGAMCAVAALSASHAAAAGEFSTSNVQLLQGWAFHDNLVGRDTDSGRMNTITLAHFSTWSHGDNFAFADLYRGDFTDGSPANLYAEWYPRLFLDRLLAIEGGGFLRHWGVAAGVKQAKGFYAYLAGAGLDLSIPGFAVAGLNVFYRYDNFNYSTWQISPFWTCPFSVGPLEFVFAGFIDLYQDKDGKLDLMTQPQLLLDLLPLVGGKPGRIHAGVEWYLHSYRDFVDGKNKVVSAPQAMLKWTVH